MRSLAIRLLLPRDPVKSEASYSWLGKRVAGLVDIADGIYNLFMPKKKWGKLGIRYCCWSAIANIRPEGSL